MFCCGHLTFRGSSRATCSLSEQHGSHMWSPAQRGSPMNQPPCVRVGHSPFSLWFRCAFSKHPPSPSRRILLIPVPSTSQQTSTSVGTSAGNGWGSTSGSTMGWGTKDTATSPVETQVRPRDLHSSGHCARCPWTAVFVLLCFFACVLSLFGGGC